MQDSLFECRISLLACKVSLFEFRIPLFECRISLVENRICPRIFQDFGRYPPKWFLAITCTIWLRLEFRGLDSAWFFSPHLLFFHAQGWIFGPRIGFWIPRSTCWPGDLFGVKNGSRKKSFCRGKGSQWGLRGFCKTEMDCMVSRTLLGRPISPQTLPENNFPHFPGFREKFGAPPWPSMVDPLLALCGAGKVPWGACLTSGQSPTTQSFSFQVQGLEH